MNPAQYKQAMRQRALDRQASLQLLATQQDNPPQLSIPAPRGGLAATYPARRSSSIVRGGKGLLSRFDSDGDIAGAATLQASSAEKSAFGLDVLRQKQSAGRLKAEGGELSPLVPGPRDRFRKGTTRASGFDKQAQPPRTIGVSPRDDLWGDDGEEEELSFVAQRRERKMLGWERFPGETSITTAVRMYFANLDEDASHEENCGVVLHQILERVATEELDVPALKMRHVVKMEAFLRAVVLSVPARTWKQSFRGAFTLTASAADMKSAGHGQHISLDELTFRMNLFVGMLRAEREGGGEVDEAVDAMRVKSVVRGYAANAAEILPLQHPARSLLPPLLYCMACEMLNVRLLAPEVRDVCGQIVSDYESRAKLWMSPAQNAERYLLPLVTEFASWMRRNKEILYQGSATEGLLRSIDERLRCRLKNQVYRSPQHFLDVLRSMEAELTDMPLPPYDASGGDDDQPFDVCQTVKDVSRERFDVNCVPTDPSDCWCKIRASFLHAVLEHHPEISADEGGGGLLTRTESFARASGRKDGLCGPDSSTLCDTTVEEESAASGDAAAGNRVAPGGNGVNGEGKAGKGKVWGVGHECKGGMKGNRRASKSGLDMYLDQCAWRVLHAASRTASGGDCFFVVQDLFGGDGVLVKMATAATESIKIRTKGMAARVTTVDKYDIYHTSDVDINSAFSEASPRPLMTITTTMKEVIQFSPYADTPTGRKSAVFAEEHASQTPDEAANRHPSHAWSGRFITISADLPDYPEHHLDASSGVLVAPPLAAPSAEETQHLQNRAAVSGVADTAALAVNDESTLPRSNSTRADPPPPPRPPVYGPASLCPHLSAFNSPPPARPLKGREMGADCEITSDDSSGSSACFSGDEEEGEGEGGRCLPLVA